MASVGSPDSSEFEVVVQLKPEVLDPEARAIQETLARIGYDGVRSVQVSKRYILTVDDKSGQGAALVESVAREFLANPVSETFQVRKL
ncbi:MAG: phosphoribosylformylglycinamidine synthase subunit PurS [Deltaproteobacteria bacterium]|nr:phosphoribosylformylglycinamidine synthase subunit PurS [Deltaproteobacteria bacterium]